jgi:hypothetical protein
VSVTFIDNVDTFWKQSSYYKEDGIHNIISLCFFPHLDKRKTYVRMLFIDYSSAFNTIVTTKLRTLGLNASLCNWILDFPTSRPQLVRVANNTSATLILNTGAPQGCVLSLLLYSLFTHDCVAKHDSNTMIKFADETTVIADMMRQPIGRRSETWQ